jgi:hypothetical protein
MQELLETLFAIGAPQGYRQLLAKTQKISRVP